ncbi:MAG: hypothetical protein QF907_02250 [Nitrospinota bacterium]|nr:hypothetical protein [Nitrospinota bacterium]HJN02329.1 hypothetical protein [Nitrospinota bacterium]
MNLKRLLTPRYLAVEISHALSAVSKRSCNAKARFSGQKPINIFINDNNNASSCKSKNASIYLYYEKI